MKNHDDQARKQLRHILGRFEDDEEFCNESLVVQNKLGKLTPAEWGFGQRRLFEAIHRQQEQGRPVRIIALKPRQAWFSTAVAMKFFKETAFVDGQATMVIAHDLDSAKKIFEYYKRFQQHYKPFGGIISLPNLITPKNLDNPNQELMKWDNGSYIQVETANNIKGGRSFTARRIHLSEYAFYSDAATLMTGLMQTLPDDKDTMLVIESTANGMGGAFFDAWNRACDGKNDFQPVFFAWWEHEEYEKAFDGPADRFQDSMSREEWELKQSYGLSLEQINWRRWAIANKCEGDIDRFRQEYPATAEEAFLTSGRPRFRPVYVRQHQAADGERGELRQDEVGTQSILRFDPNERGALTVWATPKPGKSYVIGADTSEGIDINEGAGTPDPDYSSADVFEASIRVQVAQLHERLTPSEFGRYLYDLGKWYNWAYLVVEVNSSGQGTMDTLLRLGYPVHRIYKRVIHDEAGQRQTEKLGWKTTGLNRESLISGYDHALSRIGDGGIILRSRVSIQEAHTFVIKANGRAEAQAGTHDDTVISGALAVEGLSQAQATYQPQSERAHESYPAARHYGPTVRERTAQAFGYQSAPPQSQKDVSRWRNKM
jgi:hypothetical protein